MTKYNALCVLSEQVNTAYEDIHAMVATYTPPERRKALYDEYHEVRYKQFLDMLGKNQLMPSGIFGALMINYDLTHPVKGGYKPGLGIISSNYNVHHTHMKSVGGDNSLENMSVLYKPHHATIHDIISAQLSREGVKNVDIEYSPALFLSPKLAQGKYFYDEVEMGAILELFHKEYKNYCRNMDVPNIIANIIKFNIVKMRKG